MTRPPGDDFALVLVDLYEGTIDDAAWDRAIIRMANMVRASGALLMVLDPASGAVIRAENHLLDPNVLRDYQRYWAREDPRPPAGLSYPTGYPVTEQTLHLRDWRRSAVLNEFLLPSDIPHFMPAWLHKSATKLATLSFQATRKRGPFQLRDLEIYKRLLPHISRALDIRDRLERAKIRADALATHLETLSFGLAILDSGGKLLESNPFFLQLAGSNRGISLTPDGALSLRGSAGRELDRWIATGVAPPDVAEGVLHVPNAIGQSLSVTVAPLPINATSWLRGDPRWLLAFFDPQRRLDASAALIARDLCISKREGELAALLASGHSLQSVAKCFGVSEHTARAQVKSIFRKTGTHTQSDLIRRIALGPAWARTSPPKS